jgi:hypothetical protein
MGRGEEGVDEKNSCRKEPKRAEKRKEVLKDRLSTAVCIGFVESRKELLKGRNVPSLCSNSHVHAEHSACGPHVRAPQFAATSNCFKT